MADGEILLQALAIRHVYRDDGVATPVLQGLDLTVRRGEFLVITGPSGCGKTTLLHILGLMMRPTGGGLRIADRDASQLGDAGRTRMRREFVGFVFQRFNLLPMLSARGNIELALRLRGQPIDGRAMDALNRVGLAHKADRKPRALSVGEQQRVAIARAIVARPRLLLADEPTGNLDTTNANGVLDLLRELHASDGLTSVMITHNDQLAARGDRVLAMRDGQWVGGTA